MRGEMKPLSDNLLPQIIEAGERSEGTGEVSELLKVSRKSVERFWEKHGMTGECWPKKIEGYRRSRLEKHAFKRWIGQ